MDGEAALLIWIQRAHETDTLSSEIIDKWVHHHPHTIRMAEQGKVDRHVPTPSAYVSNLLKKAAKKRAKLFENGSLFNNIITRTKFPPPHLVRKMAPLLYQPYLHATKTLAGNGFHLHFCEYANNRKRPWATNEILNTVNIVITCLIKKQNHADFVLQYNLQAQHVRIDHEMRVARMAKIKTLFEKTKAWLALPDELQLWEKELAVTTTIPNATTVMNSYRSCVQQLEELIPMSFIKRYIKHKPFATTNDSCRVDSFTKNVDGLQEFVVCNRDKIKALYY